MLSDGQYMPVSLVFSEKACLLSLVIADAWLKIWVMLAEQEWQGARHSGWTGHGGS